MTKFCTNCGDQISAENKFCAKCGTPQSGSPKESGSFDSGFKFNVEAAKKMPKINLKLGFGHFGGFWFPG